VAQRLEEIVVAAESLFREALFVAVGTIGRDDVHEQPHHPTHALVRLDHHVLGALFCHKILF
jgi:nanoRNase/pAp phosphatase (c-di-AMP/oligoRNAs hydrolase)